MKTLLFSICFLAAALAPWQTARAYSPPSDRAISQVLANPNNIEQLLGDADGEQAAELLQRILQRINDSSLVESQKNYLAAYFTARITMLLGDQAEDLATNLLPNVPPNLLPAVLAGMSAGGRGSASFMAHLRNLAGEDEDMLQAINNPHIVLTEPVYNQLTHTLETVQNLPPGVTDTLPPFSPATLEEPDDDPAPRPVIPDTYDGQN